MVTVHAWRHKRKLRHKSGGKGLTASVENYNGHLGAEPLAGYNWTDRATGQS